MRGKSTPGYVLKVAVASASIGCATLVACDSQHPVGTVASPPQPVADPTDAGATTTATANANANADAAPPASTVAHGPETPDAAAPAKSAPAASVAAPPRPKPPIRVGIVAGPPDDLSPVVGTTAHAPDSKP